MPTDNEVHVEMSHPLLSPSTLEHVQTHMRPALWTWKSIRFQTVIYLGVVMLMFCLLRNSMSMAMVDIVAKNSTEDLYEDPLYQMDWSGDQQAQVHTSFYVAGLVSVACSQYAVERFGAKNLLSFGLLLNAVGSLLVPFLAVYLRHYLFVVAVRLVMGFGFGVLVPGGSVVIAKWFPVGEKSTAMAIFTLGNQIGIAIAMLLTAKLCQIPWFGGWPIAFELYGFVGLVVLVVWHFRVADKPRQSKFITASELDYIQGGKSRRKRADTIIVKTPYAKILTNGCVVAICLCSFAQSFVGVALITYLPKYNQKAMKMSLNNNGIWSAVPFITQMVTKMLFGVIADKIKARKVDVTTVTKVSNAIASFGSAFCIGIVTLLPIEQTQAIQILIAISMALFSAYVPGYNTSLVTVAPQFTAFISSYAQFYAQAASTLAPIVIGHVTQNDTIEEWKMAFLLLTGVLVISGAAFQLLGHGRTEPWGEPASLINSTRQSTCLPDEARQLNLDIHNSNLQLDPFPEAGRIAKSSRVSRVSYADDEVVVSLKMDELENDVIYSIEEEKD